MRNISLFYWDMPERQMILLPMLQRRYASVVSATDKDTARDIIGETSSSYSAALIDYSLPYFYGGELIRVFRETSPATPIVCMATERLFSDQLDYDIFLQKPFSMGELEQAIEEAIREGRRK